MHLRDEFEITQLYTYLNTAATSPLPRYVVQEIRDFHTSRSMCAECAWDVWKEKVYVARERAAALIGADWDEIAFLKNTSEGLNTASAMLPAEGNVVTTSSEFPSNYLPWKRKYGDVRLVGHHGGVFDVDDFEEAIDDDTVAVTISEVTYDTGSRLPTREIARIAHDHGALVVSDAVQALGAVQLDVDEAGIDILCSGGHKWLTSPFGVGIFYVSREVQEHYDPPFLGWASLEDETDFSLDNTRLAGTARKFEIGNLNFSGILGLSRSIQTMFDYGIERIEDEVMTLSTYLMERLANNGRTVVTPRDAHAGIVSIEDDHASESVARLLSQRIAVAERGGVRVSPHFWNTKDDLDAFLDAYLVT
jgi:selenocysteine lyase/cysteine desulfurase